MILWTLISILLIFGSIIEGNRRGWKWPEYNSIETITVLWFAFSFGMYITNP